MFIVLGGTGHIGSAVAEKLIARGEAVTIVSSDAAKAEPFEAKGIKVAIADVRDADALRAVLRTGRRAFLLNPPAAVDGDTDAAEHVTLKGIVAALDGSGLEKLVAQSTYGAQPGDRIGDLSVLYDFEQALAAQTIPAAILRAAFLMTNWDQLVEPARGGTLPTMYPADLSLPMVAPDDVADAAVDLLLAPASQIPITHVEGPAQYTPADVAAAFATALAHPVEVKTIPREKWHDAYRDQGFSEAAADAFARMAAVSVDGGFTKPSDPRKGTITLERYITDLVVRS